MTTGNVLRRWKPVQHAANGPSSEVIYDTRQLFPASETNELGHLVELTWDYGTGTKLMSDGPNVRGCITGPGCPSDATHPLKEQNKIRIDGLGRMLERWESFSGDGYLYQLFLVETNVYTAATATVPESVFHQRLIDIAGTMWTQDKAEIDGHGRPIKQTVFVQSPGQADHVTSYTYRADGTLQNVTVPNPALNDATTVSYTYGFDSLGRATSIRRPDAAAQSGVNVTYDQVGSIGSVCPQHSAGNGVMQTAVEVPGTDGGLIGSTRTTTDSFGRLVRVEEQTGPSTWATTKYCYGPDGNVKTIVDPQSVTTTLEHDFAGRRTKITRTGNRQWKYTYDPNGNLIAEQVPGSPSPPITDPAYTTTIAYDALDRPLSKVIGQRNLSAADQLTFGNKTELFVYDADTNMKGRLRHWYAYDPAGSWTVANDFRTDIQGRPSGTVQQLNVAGFPALAREIYQSWYAIGPLQHMRHGDIVGAGTFTTWTEQALDARGLPHHLTIRNQSSTGGPGTTFQDVGVQTRNVAGLVTQRRSVVGTAMGFVESNWVYDKLGRVTSQTVVKGPSSTQVVRQDLTYTGTDDVKTLRHYLGTTNRLFTHTFDLRHQLTNVTTTGATSYFGATYVYGNAGRLTKATQTRTINPAPAGADLKLVRNVTYGYGVTEPEQVIALTNVSGGGATYASYTYDAAGNQLTRSYPVSNELWEYVYDGKDQLRRATRKLGGVVQGSEEYWYDGSGQRLAIVKRNASGGKTEMIWFIGDTQAHYDGNGVVTHIYSHLSIGTPVARVDRTGDTTTTTEFQFHGLASNMIAAVAQNGTINASFSYAPFGEVLEATNAGGTGQSPVHKRRFNDKLEDDLSGLTYYGARFFDKTLIGWTQADPLYIRVPDAAQLNSPRRANVYAFSLNNSLRYVDPDGLDVKGPVPGLDSYRSEMETSAAGRANNMAADGWEQGCSAYLGGGWCSGGGGGGGGHAWDKGPCGGGLCEVSPAERAAACDRVSCDPDNTELALTVVATILTAGLSAEIGAILGAGGTSVFATANAARAAAVTGGTTLAPLGVRLYHGSVSNYSGIVSNGLDPARAPTWVTTSRTAAENAIGSGRVLSPGQGLNMGIVQSIVPQAQFNRLIQSGAISETRTWPGFGGGGVGALTENVLRTAEAIHAFNSGIVR